MKKKELWLLINKEAKSYVRSSGKALVKSLIKKRRYLEEKDIICELTISVVEKLINKPTEEFVPSFFRKVFKNELLNWIKHNNRQYRNEGYTIHYIEEPVDEEEIILFGILPGIQGKEPTPEDYMIAKQLEEYINKYFEDEELSIIFEKISREDVAKKLNIPYSTYNHGLNEKIKKFKNDARKGGYI